MPTMMLLLKFRRPRLQALPRLLSKRGKQASNQHTKAVRERPGTMVVLIEGNKEERYTCDWSNRRARVA
jgi:hypothetical protein